MDTEQIAVREVELLLKMYEKGSELEKKAIMRIVAEATPEARVYFYNAVMGIEDKKKRKK